MYYLMVKQLHITTALISISLFMVRAYWSVTGSPRLQQRWVRIVPHINDTILLGCALYLANLLYAWPTTQDWVAAKVIALLAYILVGSVAIKRGKTARIRLIASVVAVMLFAYIGGTAIAHNPLSWLALL